MTARPVQAGRGGGARAGSVPRGGDPPRDPESLGETCPGLREARPPRGAVSVCRVERFPRRRSLPTGCAPVPTVPGGTTVLVELTPDIHICGICKQQFNNLDAFVGHKQSGCQLSSAAAGAASTVQFVSEETVPSTPAQSAARTVASETQTITGTIQACI